MTQARRKLKKIEMTDPVMSLVEVQTTTWRNWSNTFDSEQVRSCLIDGLNMIQITHQRNLKFVISKSAYIAGMFDEWVAMTPDVPLHLSLRPQSEAAHQAGLESVGKTTVNDVLNGWDGLSDEAKVSLILRAHRALISHSSYFPRTQQHITVAGAIAVAVRCGGKFEM